MGTQNDQKIYIVIATHGRTTLLDRTLSSLKECSMPDRLDRVVVVENGAKCSAEDVVCAYSKFLPLQYLYHPVANKSCALNFAIEHIDDGLILFFDDDVRFVPETIMAYDQGSSTSLPGSFWGGPVGVDYEAPPSKWLQKHLPRSATGWALPESERHRPDWFLGANWAAMASDLRNAGGFDVGFGPGDVTVARGQETNMQRRLRDMGIVPRYLSSALVYHYVPKERSSFEWLLDRRRQEGRGYGLRSNQRNIILRFTIFCFSMTAILYNYLVGFVCKLFNSSNMLNYSNTRISHHLGVLSSIKVF